MIPSGVFVLAVALQTTIHSPVILRNLGNMLKMLHMLCQPQ